MNKAMNEWSVYVSKFNAGATRSELLVAARSLTDADNRSAALRNLGVLTNKERREIRARWDSINAVTDAECRLHCQFDGLL